MKKRGTENGTHGTTNGSKASIGRPRRRPFRTMRLIAGAAALVAVVANAPSASAMTTTNRYGSTGSVAFDPMVGSVPNGFVSSTASIAVGSATVRRAPVSGWQGVTLRTLVYEDRFWISGGTWRHSYTLLTDTTSTGGWSSKSTDYWNMPSHVTQVSLGNDSYTAVMTVTWFNGNNAQLGQTTVVLDAQKDYYCMQSTSRCTITWAGGPYELQFPWD